MAANAPALMSWDSCIVLDCLQKQPGQYEFISPLVKQGEAGDLIVVVSTIVITEVHKIGELPGSEDERLIDQFFDYKWVHPEDCSQGVAKVARGLRREHPTNNLDSIILATAKSTNCRVLLTRDGEGKRKKRPLLPLDSKIQLEDETPLRILTPEQYQQMSDRRNSPLVEKVGPLDMSGADAESEEEQPEAQGEEQPPRPEA